MNPEEIARLQAAGFSAAEIAAYTAKPSATTFAAESTAQRGLVRAPKAESLGTLLMGTARAGAQGASFGFADEAEAGVRSLAGGSYRQIRDDVRRQNDAFSDAHQVVALGANIVGGLATGGAALKAAQGVGKVALAARLLAPNVLAEAPMAARIGQGARAGGLAGMLAGAGGAKESGDVVKSAVVNGVLGAGLGAGAGAVGDVVRSGRNLVSRIGQGQAEAGAVRRAIRADAPEQSAIRRFLALLAEQKQTVGTFAGRSVAADAPDIAGEVIGARGVRAVRTARGLGYEAPDMIEGALTTRARNDVGRVRQTVARELGPQIDDTALPQQKLLEAQTASAPLYRAALDGVTVSDPRVVAMLERPNIRSAYATAREMAANDGDALPDAGAILRNARRGADAGADDVASAMPLRVPLPDDGLPRNLTRLSGDDLDTALARVATLRDQDLAESQLIPSHVRLAVGEEGAVGMTGAQVAERRAAARARGLSPSEIRSEGADLSEDMIGAIEAAGYDVNEWVAANRAMAQASFRLRAREASMARLEQESARRASGAPNQVPDDAPLPRAYALPDAADAPELPRLSGRQLQYTKLALNDAITKLEGGTGGTTTTQYAQLVKARNEIDGLLYEFSNAADDGSSLWGQANAAYAKPMREAESFRDGVRSGRNIQAPDVPRLLAGPEAEWTARGVANTIQDDLARLGDGAAGPIRNPAPTLMGSDAARARLEVAAGGDLGKVGQVEDVAANVARRLQTRQIVTGGSQTAEKLADQAGQSLKPSDLIAAAASPRTGLIGAAAKGLNAVQRNVLGQDMDAFAKLLMAGGPQQMTRVELVALLRQALPALEQAQRRSLLIRGQMANQTGQRVQP